jgi:adenylate kinase
VRLIFMGPPGSGKGTQAERLMARTGLVQLSSGQVLRDEIKAGSPIGQRARQYVESGGLVPDDVITGVILAAIDKLGADQGFILDGFPRTVPQAEALTAGFSQRGWELSGVLDFRMPDDEIIRRIGGRRVCSDCGATYNTDFLPPKAPGVCDKCGGKVVQRKDDLPDVVKNRLDTYRAQTAPLVAYFTQRGVLHPIDSSREARDVERQVQNVVAAVSANR